MSAAGDGQERDLAVGDTGAYGRLARPGHPRRPGGIKVKDQPPSEGMAGTLLIRKSTTEMLNG